MKYSKQEIREAILRTIDVLEQTPDRYKFTELFIPSGSGPGCLLGLIGQQLGMEGGLVVGIVATSLGFQREGDFYREMNKFERELELSFWISNPRCAAAVLGAYAARI